MILKLLNRTGQSSRSSYYWWMYIIIGLSALAVALYHQHYLEEPPCVVCIQVRLCFLLLIIVSTIGLFLHHTKLARDISNLLVVIIFVILSERSYLLLGTERGFIFSDCGFDLGLPIWLAIEDWFPWLFRIESACGYTPELFFGITMAEALIVISVLFLLFSFAVLVTGLITHNHDARS